MSANPTSASSVSPTQALRNPETIEKEFDAYAAQYEAALNEGLSVSGEGPEYFAQRRIQWTAEVLKSHSNFDSVLDFGCGVGIATPLLRQYISPKSILGFDPSTAAIKRAQSDFPESDVQFTAISKEIPSNQFDLAYCNGVFHHIMPEDRDAALATVFRALKPGGWFAFWENNPWNPGTRYVMSKIPFDRDAVVISPIEAKSLLERAGFKVERRDAWFLFPRTLSWLRPLESLFHRLPILSLIHI